MCRAITRLVNDVIKKPGNLGNEELDNDWQMLRGTARQVKTRTPRNELNYSD